MKKLGKVEQVLSSVRSFLFLILKFRQPTHRNGPSKEAELKIKQSTAPTTSGSSQENKNS